MESHEPSDVYKISMAIAIHNNLFKTHSVSINILYLVKLILLEVELEVRILR